MQYDREIHLIYERLRNDKTVTQPWRNKAISRLQEAQAFIRMGQSTAYPDQPNRVDAGTASTCTCQPGIVDKNCPVHGSM